MDGYLMNPSPAARFFARYYFYGYPIKVAVGGA
jgi:hypothetical protein